MADRIQPTVKYIRQYKEFLFLEHISLGILKSYPLTGNIPISKFIYSGK